MKKYREQLWIVLFFLFVSTVSGAESWQEPEDFRGLKWGASVDEMHKVFPTHNVGKPRDFSNRIQLVSVGGQRIGDALVQLDLGFLDDRFSSVNISFKSADFPVMRDAFITRYGPAHSTTEQTLQNRAGAEFVSPVLTWRGPYVVHSGFKILWNRHQRECVFRQA